MTESVHCPDCGRENPAGATVCAHCNHPLTEDHHVSAAAPVQGEAPKPTPQAAPASETPILIRRTIRPRPPRPPGANQAVQLWLVFGTVAAVALVWSAFQSAR